MSGSEIKIVYTALDILEKWPRNPKLHDIPELKKSLRRFGFVAPIALDGRTGKMVAGHGRLEALIAMRDAGEPAPKRIRVKNGVWSVPVLHGVEFETEQEAEAYVVADNRLTENGGWDNAALDEILRDLDSLEGTGIDEAEMERISREVSALADSVEAADTEQGEAAEDNDALPRRWSAPPDAVTLTIGRFRFNVKKDKFLVWEEELRQKVGFEKDKIAVELLNRLGLA